VNYLLILNVKKISLIVTIKKFKNRNFIRNKYLEKTQIEKDNSEIVNAETYEKKKDLTFKEKEEDI